MLNKVHGVFVPEYTDTEHWYRHVETGALVPSVTTITSIIVKPWLIRWRISEAVKHLVEANGELVSHKDFDLAVREATLASERKAQEARIIGTEVHDIIEKYLDEWIVYKRKPVRDLIYRYEPNFVHDGATHLRYDLTQTQVIAALRSAQQLFDEMEGFKPLAVEITVGDVDHGYAGKLDLLCEVDGKLEIWDWKTSNLIPTTDPMYPIQINVYRKAFEKMTGMKIHKQRIIQLSKSEDRFTMYEVAKSKDLIKAFYSLSKFYEETISKTSEYYQRIHKHS